MSAVMKRILIDQINANYEEIAKVVKTINAITGVVGCKAFEPIVTHDLVMCGDQFKEMMRDCRKNMNVWMVAFADSACSDPRIVEAYKGYDKVMQMRVLEQLTILDELIVKTVRLRKACDIAAIAFPE